ncbi:type I-E CRISPR-associated protein Cse1/CasA [[Pseudomonas] boreopolis]|uniref:type I-E CRISPR-associated protein Cse1/CasA n=1 Tax=Xanthomonas boreopolis TaxID=86183 RepID=UPI003DA12805
MNKDFNLLDKPWLPVRFADGHIEELGLLGAFRRSDQIVALAETAPPNLVAQYRLLLAILHRALTRAFPEGWKDKDRARWYREGLPVEAVADYLEHWRERFWLFHPECPFMQVAALDECDETQSLYPPSTLSLEQFYGTGMFNQEVFRNDAWWPRDVIKSMMGYFQFVPGGFFPGKKLKVSEKAGALTDTAAILPLGASLAQTLTLCLHGWRGGDDLPAWERARLTVSELRGDPVLATGPNDRYTRQSRAVLLLREPDGSIRWLRFAAGFALGEDANAPDPMASFRVSADGTKLVRLSFGKGRALWRDLPVLVPNPSRASHPAAVISHALELHAQLNPFESVHQPLLVAGLASDQAKLLRWRSESIALPVALLENADKAGYLRDLVEKAEAVFGEIRKLAARMLAETLPDAASKDTYNRARSMLDTGPFTTSYYATAERTLPELLRLLGEGDFVQATTLWHATLRHSALTAWERASTGLGRSPRALRADAKFRPHFHGLLNKHVPITESSTTAKEA